MIKSLFISNYALIEELEISFPNGLIIITGETGAGKSILLGAISLLMGAKGSRELLKNQEKNCVVEALFTTRESGEEEYLVRRVISPNGRSRSFVNDLPVTNSELKTLSEKLVDIHAQHEHLLMANSNFRLNVLDSYSKNREIKESYSTAFYKSRELEKERVKLEEQLAKELEEQEYNQFRYNQLEESNLQEGELEELESEQKLLSNVEQIKSNLNELLSLFSGEGYSLVGQIREIESLYAKLSNSLEATKEMKRRIESCRIELTELEGESLRLEESIIANPERGAIVEERLSQLYNLFTKYRVNRVEELLALKEEISLKLELSTNLEERLKLIEKEIERAKQTLEERAKRLTKSREEGSKALSKEMTTKIRELEMPYGTLSVELVEEAQYGVEGAERVEFLFSANREMPPREISKVASGGELSRVMLCLKAIMARESEMPTLIFDEIDSGVSGSIADKMGLLIGELASNMQLFVITHLPQIASKGGAHLLVYKEEADGEVKSKIKRLEEGERVMEIARMLSGSELTSAAIANAKEFLSIGKN